MAKKPLRRYLFASDFDQTLTFNDTGIMQAAELEFGDSTATAKDAEEPAVTAPASTSPYSLDEMERDLSGGPAGELFGLRL